MKKKLCCPNFQNFLNERGVKKIMKRSQISDSTTMETYRRLLAEHVQQEKDAEILQSKREDTALALRSLSKTVILRNLGHISPFRDRFLQKLGTIVDFDPNTKAIVLRRTWKDEIEIFCVILGVNTNGEGAETPKLSVIVANTQNTPGPLNFAKLKADENTAEHAYFFENDEWCCHVDDEDDYYCDCCDDESTELYKLRDLFQKYGHTVIALIHELSRLHRAFDSDPQRMFDKIDHAAASHAKKHKKDEKK